LTIPQIRDLCSYTLLQEEINEAEVNSDTRNKLYQKQVNQLSLLKEKETIKELKFQCRDFMYTLVWNYQSETEFKFYKNGQSAQKHFLKFGKEVNRILYMKNINAKNQCSTKDWESTLDTYFKKYLQNYLKGKRVQYKQVIVKADDRAANRTEGKEFDLELSIDKDKVYGTCTYKGTNNMEVRIPLTGKISDKLLSWTEDCTLTYKQMGRDRYLYQHKVVLKSREEVFGEKPLKGTYTSPSGSGTWLTGDITLTPAKP